MFGLLSTIATTGNAIQRGIDLDKQRTAAEEDRQYQLGLRRQQEGDRARRLQIEAEDRQFQVGQRQRTLDEQKRADDLRAADAAVPTTRSVVDPNLPQLDDTDNPIPENLRSREVAVPKWQQLQAMAANRRKAGMTAEALKLEDAAQQEQFEDSARRFTQLRGSAGSMSALDAAREVQRIFNSDPFPMDFSSVEPDGNGVRITIKDRNTGATVQRRAATTEELFKNLEPYYNPQGYAKMLEIQRASALKREELLADPSKRFQRVGDSVFDAATGTFRQAPMRQGMEPIGEDENGNPIYRRTDFRPGGAGGTGSGAGRGGKTPDPAAAFDSAFEFVAKNSNLKDTATPAQIAQGLRLTRQIGLQNPGVDPTVAAEYALAAATDPTRVRTGFSKERGSIVQIVTDPNGTREFIIDDKGPQAIRTAKPGTYAADAQALLASLPQGQAGAFAAAAMDASGQARRQLVDSLVRSPQGMQALRAANGGKEPTAAQIEEAWRKTDADLGPSLDLIGLHLPERERNAAWSGRPGRPAGAGGPAQLGAASPIQTMSIDTLRRIANTPGHANQEAAADELQIRLSRERARPDGAQQEPGLGFGFGIAP